MNKIQFTVEDETIAGEQLGDSPEILVLHGAGLANRGRAKPLIERIVEETGKGALLFDFSGHGKSTGRLEDSSLSKRTKEARESINFLDETNGLTLIGLSMGGHIALELVKDYKIKNIILFYPGIYTQTAYNVRFNEKFSEIIRRSESWRSASVLNNLRSFEGNLLVVWGDGDQVVPKGVVDLILGSAANAQSKELFIVPEGEHLLLPGIYDDEQLYTRLLAKIKQYV